PPRVHRSFPPPPPPPRPCPSLPPITPSFLSTWPPSRGTRRPPPPPPGLARGTTPRARGPLSPTPARPRALALGAAGPRPRRHRRRRRRRSGTSPRAPIRRRGRP
ncbi:unnamed protein product, partial [Ectocarpus fasciculatus]